MAAAPRLRGRFFLLIRCCPWFMSESQCIGSLGILAGWTEGRGPLPCRSPWSSLHPTPQSAAPSIKPQYLPHKLYVCILRLCYITVEDGLVTEEKIFSFSSHSFLEILPPGWDEAKAVPVCLVTTCRKCPPPQVGLLESLLFFVMRGPGGGLCAGGFLLGEPI